MKKLILFLMLTLILTGCGTRVIYGEVQSITPEGDYIKLTILGKEESVLADSETFVYGLSGVEGSLLSGDLIRPHITAYDVKATADGYYSDRIYVESVILPEPYVLKDGTELTIRQDVSHTIYYTPDGVDLLWHQEPIGPNHVSVGNVPSLDMLDPKAQEAILAHYNALGLLYDLDAELEYAWQCYQAAENPLLFMAHHLSQDICPAAANEKLVWYNTYVTRPAGDGLHHQTSIHTIFDRETGAVIEPATLFLCSEAEAARVFLDISDMPDTQLRREMEQTFRFEYLNFNSTALDVCFPAGSLPSHSTGDYMLGIHYADIRSILQPWAVPDPAE